MPELGCTRWDEITFPQFLKWLSQSRRSIEAASWRWDRDFPLHFVSNSMSAAALCVGKSFWFYPIRLRSSTLLLMQIDTPCHSQNPTSFQKSHLKWTDLRCVAQVRVEVNVVLICLHKCFKEQHFSFPNFDLWKNAEHKLEKYWIFKQYFEQHFFMKHTWLLTIYRKQNRLT